MIWPKSLFTVQPSADAVCFLAVWPSAVAALLVMLFDRSAFIPHTEFWDSGKRRWKGICLREQGASQSTRRSPPPHPLPLFSCPTPSSMPHKLVWQCRGKIDPLLTRIKPMPSNTGDISLLGHWANWATSCTPKNIFLLIFFLHFFHQR